MASIFWASTLDGMSGSAMFAILPVLSDVRIILMTPIFSRSWRYVQNWVCFLQGTSYSSHTTA